MSNIYKVSIIISIYQDIEALNCILYSLSNQTEKNFEIIITEDSESNIVNDYITSNPYPDLHIKHLTQNDNGWRKMSAVNRAIAESNSDYLIFIDGDCIPHTMHVETHLNNKEKNIVLTGRRVYLGDKYSKNIRKTPSLLLKIENRKYFLLHIIQLHQDKIKCYEVGLRSSLLQTLTKNKHVSIVGCNFSMHKEDILKVNGYDENLVGPGAEDDDLALRLRAVGIKEKSVKFITPVYHLDHEVKHYGSSENKKITEKSLRNKQYFALNGINKHQK